MLDLRLAGLWQSRSGAPRVKLPQCCNWSVGSSCRVVEVWSDVRCCNRASVMKSNTEAHVPSTCWSNLWFYNGVEMLANRILQICDFAISLKRWSICAVAMFLSLSSCNVLCPCPPSHRWSHPLHRCCRLRRVTYDVRSAICIAMLSQGPMPKPLYPIREMCWRCFVLLLFVSS